MDKLPEHVAVIMDGNGRWAEQRSKPRYAGHKAGVTPVRRTVEHAARRGVSYLTLFAFSSENWNRPPDEVSRLMGLIQEAIRREVDELDRNDVRLRFIGSRDNLNARLVKQMERAELRTADNGGLTLNVAVSYGGRWDLTEATRRVARRVAAGELEPDAITEEHVAGALQLAGMPDPDLLIRTGGERRISNFLLWNLAYAELYFSEKLWPDFDTDEFDAALAYFAGRQRRYGHTGKQVGVA